MVGTKQETAMHVLKAVSQVGENFYGFMIHLDNRLITDFIMILYSFMPSFLIILYSTILLRPCHDWMLHIAKVGSILSPYLSNLEKIFLKFVFIFIFVLALKFH